MDTALRERMLALIDQAPELAAETLRYGLIDATLGVAFTVALLALAIWGLRRALTHDFQDSDDRIVATSLAGVAVGITSLLATVSVLGVAKVLTAPRLYILERLLKAAGGE